VLYVEPLTQGRETFRPFKHCESTQPKNSCNRIRYGPASTISKAIIRDQVAIALANKMARCATAALCATRPCSRLSGSARTSAAVCSASPSPCPRWRSAGGPSPRAGTVT
jgi:hypothetical protein